MNTVLVEGINIYENIFDTDQLSVIRGTSFIYKDAISFVANKFRGILRPLSLGASSGLFLVDSNYPNDSIDILCADVRLCLDSHEHFSLLTFAVVSASADSLQLAKNVLFTRLRMQQLKSFTVQPDSSEEFALSTGPCELSGTRIRTDAHERLIQSGSREKAKKLSKSVERRYLYGRERKQGFYSDLVSDSTNSMLSSYRFSKSLEDLSSDPSEAILSDTLIYPKLAGKVAVFYADGNNIGEYQKAAIELGMTSKGISEIDAQVNFDVEIQEIRNEFLSEVVSQLIYQERESGFAPLDNDYDVKHKLLRLETLLWGGDEMLFVMPAWQGFSFLQQFYQWNWTLSSQDIPLTHAAGLVFCHSKSPIRIIQQVARGLAESVKNSPNGRKQDGWDYMVLESIDFPTNLNVSHYFKHKYGASIADIRPGYIPSIGQGSENRAELREFFSQNKLSRRQLNLVVQSIDHVAPDKELLPWSAYFSDDIEISNSNHLFEVYEYRLCQLHEDKAWLSVAFPQLMKQWFNLNTELSHQRIWCWIHLAELWNYLDPVPQQVNRITSNSAMDPIEE